MKKHFNIAGPVRPDKHYCIPPETRVDWQEIQHLIDEERFFVLHAPRQTGKTSTLLTMASRLNQVGEYQALYINVESAQTVRDDVQRGMLTIVDNLVESAAYRLNENRLMPWRNQIVEQHTPENYLKMLLSRWASQADKPIVLMIDEVDALIGDVLVSLLRQLRDGYIGRPDIPFVHSVILCGVRDVRDYRIHASDQAIISGGSAFNIKTESLRMGNFSLAETKALYQQHTDATGQAFEERIFPELWEDTYGQPWLVNAIAYELTWRDKRLRNSCNLITLDHYWAARERLIQSRATHLDQLIDKLKEPRVRDIISPLIAGEQATIQDLPSDDLQYAEDLGLIRSQPILDIANRIYRETIPRELIYGTQFLIPQQQAWYIMPDQRLDMPKLLRAFQQFFREHADSWIGRYDYKEAGAQLLLQAFLQRIVNGGGRINREYGLGRRRTDLLIEWPLDQQVGFFGDTQRIVLELKILHKSKQATLQEGLPQTLAYADACGADEAHLIIFDRRESQAWEDKIWQESFEQAHVNKHWTITAWGA